MSGIGLPLQDSNLDYRIQSSPVGACLKDTMSASGDLPSIGAPAVGEKCPDRSGETLAKRLQRVLLGSPELSVRRVAATIRKAHEGSDRRWLTSARPRGWHGGLGHRSGCGLVGARP